MCFCVCSHGYLSLIWCQSISRRRHRWLETFLPYFVRHLIQFHRGQNHHIVDSTEKRLPSSEPARVAQGPTARGVNKYKKNKNQLDHVGVIGNLSGDVHGGHFKHTVEYGTLILCRCVNTFFQASLWMFGWIFGGGAGTL